MQQHGAGITRTGLHLMKTKVLKEKNKPELLALAARLQITGRHRMNKDELAAAIAAAKKKSAALKKVKPKAKTQAKPRATPKAGAHAEKKAGKPAAIKITAAPATKKAQTVQKAGPRPEIKAEPKRKKAQARKGTSAAIPLSDSAPPVDSIPDTQWQEDVERAKYELFVAPQAPAAAAGQGLPQEYGKTEITVMVRDPYQAFAYWEIELKKLQQAQQAIGAEAGKAHIILRVYDITGIDFTGDNARHYFDIVVNARTGSWYLSLGEADGTWCVEIGLRTAKGAFHMLARAQAVHTPRAGMSAVIDEKHAADQEQFEKVYALSGGYGSTAGSWTLQEMAAQRLKEAVSSPGLASGQPRKK